MKQVIQMLIGYQKMRCFHWGLIKLFSKEDGFRAQKVITAMANSDLIQIVSGLNPTDEVAANAQYLMDSESFIQVKN